MIRIHILIAGLLVLLAGASDTAAQRSLLDEKKLLREGARLLAQHKDEEALHIFEQVYAQTHSAQALAQMGIAEGALGRWLAADEHLRDAAARVEDPWIKRHTALLGQARSAIDQHVGELELHGNVAGAVVRIDEKEYGALPLDKPQRLVAGSATLTVSAPGYETLIRPIRIVAGTKNREVIELVRVPVIETVPAPPEVAKAAVQMMPVTAPAKTHSEPTGPPPRRSRTRLIVGGVLAGLGVAVAGTGAALFGAGSADGSGEDYATVGDFTLRASRFQVSGAVLLGIGGAALLGGIVALALPPRVKTRDKVSLVFAPALCGLTAAGTF